MRTNNWQPVTSNLKQFFIPGLYFIVISKKSQILLSFLKVKVIVNNKQIYPLLNDKPVLIEVENSNTKIVISDGFHFTAPIELNYTQPSFYYFKVCSPVTDIQLWGGVFLTAFLFWLGMRTHFLLIQITSFIPVCILLILYYLKRRSFIVVQQDHLHGRYHR